MAAFEANPLDLYSNKKCIPKLCRRLWRTDNNDGVQVSWAHPSPACCAFLQGFGSRMLHSLLLVWPGMRAIGRCFRCDARLTTFISHSSVNPAGTRTNCASEEDKPHLFPCMVMFNIPAHMWWVYRMCTWANMWQKEKELLKTHIFLSVLQRECYKSPVINAYLHAQFITGLVPPLLFNTVRCETGVGWLNIHADTSLKLDTPSTFSHIVSSFSLFWSSQREHTLFTRMSEIKLKIRAVVWR